MKKEIKKIAGTLLLIATVCASGNASAASLADDALARTVGTFTPAEPTAFVKEQEEYAEQEAVASKEQEQTSDLILPETPEQTLAVDPNALQEPKKAVPQKTLPEENAGQSPDFMAIQRGIASYQKNDLKAAYSEFTKAIELNNENPTAFVNRGIVLREMERYEDSEADFRMAKTFDAQNALIEFEMGLTALAQNDENAALAHMNKALVLQPDETGTQLYRASLLYRLGRLDDAIADYTQIIEKADDIIKIQAYIERGLAKEQKEAFADAAADYTAALALQKGNIWALNCRASCLERLGKYEEAAVDFTHLLEIVPKEEASILYFKRANSYRVCQRLNDAVADYTRALENATDALPIYIERAISYRLLDQNEEALLDIERALLIEPQNADLLNLRAIEKIKLSDLKGALADLDTAIALNPKKAAFLGNRAAVFATMGEKAKAIADYTAALRLEPKNADFYYRRGGLYHLSGQIAEAKQDYKEATAIKPDLPAY